MKKILIILLFINTFLFSDVVIVDNNYHNPPVLCPDTFEVDNGDGTLTYFGNKDYIGYQSVNSSTNGNTKFKYINNTSHVRCYESVYNWHGLSGSYEGYYNYTVVSAPTPTCSDNQHLENNSCVCNDGYNTNVDGSCSSQIDCPAPMVYKYVNVNWGLDVRTCVPDFNLSQSDCDSIPGAVYLSFGDDVSNELNQYASIFGVGCVNSDYINDKVGNSNLSFIVSGLLPNSMYVGKALGNLFLSGKNWVSNLFKGFSESPNNPSLLLDKPNVIDMKIADDGVYYQVEPTPLDPAAPVDTTTQAYNQFLKDNSFITDTADTLPAPDVDFPVSNVNKDFYYQGGDATGFNDSMIGTANEADKGVLPDLAPLDSAPNNSQVQTTIKLFDNFTQTVEREFPVSLTKTGTLSDGDNLLTDYVGDLHFPDGSSTHIKLTKTKFPDGHSLNNVHTQTEIPTSSGIKTFNTYYVTTVNNVGDVTNVTNEGSTIVSNGSDGSVVTTTNQPSGDSVTTDVSSPAIDLTPAIQRLDKIDNSIKNLSNKFDDMLNYKPANANQADITIQEFSSALNIFDANFNDYKDFLGGIKSNIDDITNQFNDAKNILENKPQLHEINGQCSFNATFYHNQIVVDPCKFVSPYRPLLTLFFTLFGTLQAFGFAAKYLIRS